MIYAVTGDLGGGKSLGCVGIAVDHIKIGGIVASNIVLIQDPVCDIVRRSPEYVSRRVYHIDPDRNPDCWTWPRGDRRGQGNRRVKIIIDEAGEWFSCLESPKAIASFLSWLRHSDKRGQDVYLIVQYPSLLAKQARDLVHYWMGFRNMEHWKMPGLGFGLPPPWRNEFHRFTFDKTGKVEVEHLIYQRDKRLYQCYETAASFGGSANQSDGFNPYDDIPQDEGFTRTPDSRSINPFFLLLALI